MAKFMILYNSSTSASEAMANATPEQMKASMDEWIQWKDEAIKSVKFEFGMPLQSVSRITTEGVGQSDTHVSGYAIMEGAKDAVIQLLRTHPQLKNKDASIDVLEMLSMPGIES